MTKGGLIGIALGVIGFVVILNTYGVEDKKPVVKAAAPAAPTAEQIAYCGERLAKQVIRASCKDPESVKFLNKTAEQYYPGTGIYVCKWWITATNSYGGRVQGYGVAGVHYKGGDPYDNDNWEIEDARIIEGDE